MTYTPKQKKAIENKGNMLISAAAGSGKTRVLTDRICQIIQKGEATVDELLVLTFTKSAASEMKKRIYNSLLKISDSERLGIMAEQVSRADISTIHGFCQRVIREKYHVLGLSPSFKIGSDKDNARILRKSLAELLEEKALCDDASLNHLYLTYGKRNGKALNEMIIKIYYALIVLPEPEAYADAMLAQYNSASYKRTIKQYFLDDAKQKLLYAEELLQNSLSFAKTMALPKAQNLLLGYLDELAPVKQLLSQNNFEAFKTASVFSKNFTIEKLGKDIKAFFTDNKKRAAELVKSAQNDARLTDFDNAFDAEIITVKADADALIHLALALRDRYNQAKLQKNTLDFSDLEHYAYAILKDPKQAKAFNYKYIFLDEYQDTNPLQEEIISKIKGAHNLFMVGDVKQSIYAFRHADPDIFLQKQKTYLEYEQKKDNAEELVRMNENFRSSKTVVDAINLIMGNILTLSFGGIDYKNKESLVHKSVLNEGNVALDIVDASSNFLQPAPNGQAITATEAEAFAIANKITKIKGQPYFNRELNTQKQIDYKDVVILLRELNTSGPVYKRVFESCGIPVDMTLKTGSTQLPETEVFTNILKTTLNPTDDVALISAMKYTFFGFSSEAFAKIRIAANGKRCSFYTCVDDYVTNNTDPLAKKIAVFFKTLAHIKQKSMTLSGEAFLSYVFNTLQFQQTLSASPRKSLKADVLKGYIHALLAETPKSAHLARMVALLNEMKQNGETLQAETIHKNPNSVRIMTIHKSKGLEFPVVFVAGLNKSFKRENTASFVMDKTLGFGFKLSVPRKNLRKEGLVFLGILQKQKLASLHEEIRVLYVAMTRAENRLYMVSAVNFLATGLSRWLASGQHARFFAGSFLDLIAPTLLSKQNFAQGFAIARVLPPNLSNVPFINIILKQKQGYAYTKEIDRKAKLRAFLSMPASPIHLGYTYASSNSLGVPSKRSVSSLKPKTHVVVPRKTINFTALDASQLTGAERGTAFHSFMQHADFNHSTLAQVKQHIVSLVARHILTPDEAVTLSADKMIEVLTSPIITRAKNATTVYREKNFSLKMDSGDINLPPGETVIVQGTIDLCFIEDGAFVVVDYKTDSATGMALDTRMPQYKTQIEIYANALTRLTRLPVKEKHLYFLNSQCIKV